MGVGAYLGSAPGEPAADEESDALVAAYPEVGVHYWVTPRVRLTSSASYYVTTSAVNREFPLIGVSLSFLPFDGPTEYVPPAECGAAVDDALDACEPWPAASWTTETAPSEPWPQPR